MFDPFGWTARFIPEKILHRLVRAAVLAVLAVFLWWRVEYYDQFLLKPLWAVETLIYVTLMVAFLLRLDPRERSRGVREIVVPLAGGVAPFALLLSPPQAAIGNNLITLQAVFWWMTVASALTVWGMWSMRRTFSITVEARALVTSGPYRWLRHPIYAGELLTAAAVTLWRFSILNLFVFAAFVAIQLLRARSEEQKLARVFPEYTAWADGSWWFWRVALRAV